MEHIKYKFAEEGHVHLLWTGYEEEYKPLTGTTTILEVLGKPLTWWAAGLAVKEFSGIEDCKVLTKIKNGKATKAEKIEIEEAVADWLANHQGMTEEEYIDICIKAYGAHAVKLDDTAQEGTDLHAELERFVSNQMMCYGMAKDKTKYDEKIQPFINWSAINVERFIGSEVHCYDEELWVGGICDCIAEMKNGEYAIIDFKRAKDAYFSHFAQCGGYHLQLSKHGGFDKDGNFILEIEKPITKYIVIPFGKPVFEPVENNNIKGFQNAFTSLVNIYREKSAFENK